MKKGQLVLSLEIEELSFKDNLLLSQTNYTFSNSGLYLLLGKNGSGKSTLLSILSGQFHKYDGKLFLNDIEIKKSNTNNYIDSYISFVPQTPVVFDNMTCLKNVFLPYSHKDKEKAIKILTELRLENVINSNASQLSMGEKQRLAFARCLYDLKPVLLLDEITSNLDEVSAQILEEKILEISKTHLVIFVTHEQTSLLSSTATVLEIKDQKIQEISSNKFQKDVEESYTPVTNEVKIKRNSIIKDSLSFTKEKLPFSLGTFFVTLIFLFISMLGGMVIQSVYPNRTSDFNYANYMNSPSYIVKFPNDDSVYNIFPKEDTFAVLERDFIISTHLLVGSNVIVRNLSEEDINKRINSGGGSFSGLVGMENFEKELTLIDGRFPEANNEIVISSLCYDNLLYYITKDQVYSMSVQHFSVPNLKIVGVYQADDTSIFNKRFQSRASGESYLSEVRISLGYKLETVFTLPTTIDTDAQYTELNYLVVNRNNNKDRLKKEYIASAILADFSGVSYHPITIDENGYHPFDILRPIAYYMSFSIYVFAFLALVILVSYYFVNKRQSLLLRVTGMSRKRQIKKTFSGFALSVTCGYILAAIASFLYLVFGNMYYEATIIQSNYSPYLLYSWSTLGYISIGFAVFLLVAFLACFFFYSPIKLDRQLNELKRK